MQHAPDIHPGSLRGGGEEDVDNPQRGHVRLAGDGRLDGVLGRSQAELDQLAVNHLKYFFIDIRKTFFSCKIIYLILDSDSTDL